MVITSRAVERHSGDGTNGILEFGLLVSEKVFVSIGCQGRSGE